MKTASERFSFILQSWALFQDSGMGELFEPTRVFRRQFILSHATLADSSNWR